jgi:hypothetical protein
MEKIYLIDRIAGEKAVCECLKTGEIIELAAKNRPKGAKEGDIIRLLPEGDFAIDHELTNQRLQNLTNRMNNLFKR